MFELALYFFMVFGLVSAAYAVWTSSIVKAVFSMFAAFFSVSALMIFANAEFIAIAHLMIYIGGIIVVMIFAVMLSNKNVLSEEKPKVMSSTLKFTRIITALFILALFIYLADMMLNISLPENTVTESNINIKEIGVSLLAKYALPLEIISLMLLVALIGAALISRKEQIHE